MQATQSVSLAIAALLATGLAVGACHTTAGAGQDIAATGHVITHDAVKATP
jgi:predicted small secreted protein